MANFLTVDLTVNFGTASSRGYYYNLLLSFVAKAAYTIVDELCEFSPTMMEDSFFHKMDVDIPYTKESRKYKVSYGEGSATKVYV